MSLKNFSKFLITLFIFANLFTVFILSHAFISTVETQAATPSWKEELQQAKGTLPGGGEERLENVIQTVINTALSFVGIIFLILMIYGGYLWMLARGNEQQVEKAKKLIEAAVIGLVIVMSAYAISVFVLERVMGGGEEIACPPGQELCTCVPTSCPTGEMCFESFCITADSTCPETCP